MRLLSKTGRLSKIVSLVLALVLNLSAPSIVLSQEAVGDTSTTSADSSSTIVTDISTTTDTPAESPPPTVDSDLPQSDADTQAAAPDDSVTPMLESDSEAAVPESTVDAISPTMESFSFGGSSEEPSVQSQSVFTSTSPTPKVDGPTGALIENIPLDIPPGRNGLQPDLALQYNSQRTEDGIVGYGWSVTIPYVERLNKTGSQNLYGNDPYFSSSIDGELATDSTSTPATYRAKVDEGQFNLYSYATSSNTWTMYDKSGTRYLFGASDATRQQSTSSPVLTSRWMLEEARDTNDNYIKYAYSKENNQIYPSQIVYTGHGSTDGNVTVDFTKATRPDPVTDFHFGYKIVTSSRLTQITASVSGTWVRKYDLSYTSGNNGVRSLLSSIQQSGRDDGGTVVTPPAITFGYVSSTTAFVAPGTTPDVRGAGWVVTDANGNGRNDVTIFFSASMGGWGADLYADQTSYVSGITPPEVWASQSNAYDTRPPNERGVRFVDINADGKADVVQGLLDDQNSTTTLAMYLNTYATSTGYAWTATSTASTTIPIFGEFTSNGQYHQTVGILGDVNGDGLPDFESALPSVATNGAYLGNGGGWDTATTTIFDPPMNVPNAAGTPQNNSQLIDINGDGLSDWVYSDSSNTYARLNNGTGWESTPDAQWTIATSTYYYSTGYSDRGMRFVDINGDGLPDFIRAYQTASHTPCATVPDIETADVKFVMLNTGSGWATSTAYTLPGYITTGIVTGGSPCNFTGEVHYNEYANWSENGQHTQDVISTITYPRGGSTDVTYKATTQQGTHPQLPVSLLTVIKTVTHDGFGNDSQIDYSYSSGKLYLAGGPRENKFAGFASVTKTAPDAIVTTYYNQADGASSSLGELSDGYGQLNHPFREDISTPSSALVQKKLNRWDTIAHGNSTFVGLGREMVQSFASDGTHRDKATEYTYATSTGDLIKVEQFGEVTGSSDGTYTDTGTDKRTQTISYAASSTVNLSVPAERLLVDYSSATSSYSRFYYDGLSLGQVNSGNQTRQENWQSGTSFASTTKTYNSYGLVTAQTDSNGNQTTYTYDSANMFPATVTNALSQANTYTYNYSNGEVKQVTNPNSGINQNVYDGIGRVVEINQSDPASPSSLLHKSTFQFTDSSSPPSTVHRVDYLNSATTTDTYQYYDGLSRLVQERRSSENSGTLSAIDKTYNSAGKLASESLPYFSSGTSRTSATTTPALFSNYLYDALGRVTSSANAVSTTTTTYAKWTATTTDPLGHSKDFTSDAFGNLVLVHEYVPSTQSTSYEYDAANNLTKITDALGNIRNFTYDGLGRRLSAQDLHDTGDGTFGSWSYTYDDAGNLVSQTDPKSQTVTRSYDALSRLVSESLSGTGTQVANTYDSCTNGVGQLCTASSTAAINSYAYDVLGRTVAATTTIVGSDFAIRYTYDRQNNLTDIIYPNNSNVSYAYSAGGRVAEIRTTPSGGTSSPIVTKTDYEPTGALSYREFANGIKTAFVHDNNKLGRLLRIFTSTSTSEHMATSTVAFSDVQDISYVYDVNGNITRISDVAVLNDTTNRTSDYGYDYLNRLILATTSITSLLTEVASTSPFVDVLIIGGGGGGGQSGGGGAGGYVYEASHGISEGTYPVVVGSGGSQGANGGGSSFDSVSASGGGYGGNGSNDTWPTAGGSGGSGGGGGANGLVFCTAHNGGTGSQGHNGGNGDYMCGVAAGGGGGGGAGAAGSNSNGLYGGVGGNGSANSITGSSVTYAGGGGGRGDVGGGAAGGSGGGGTGGTAGTNGLGGGGGAEASGGSGIVVIRYLTTGGVTATGGSVSTSYPYTIHTFTASSTWEVSDIQDGDTATTTYATTTITTGRYSYDALGSITTKSDASSSANTYVYEGTSYTNPHAVTSIGDGTATTTYAYDNNGNLTSAGTSTYAYDYANRMTQSVTGAATTTFGYDYSGNRVFQQTASTTVFYPSKYFSEEINGVNGTSTSYVYANDQLVAEIFQKLVSGVATGTPSTYYVHPDHLGSVSVLSDASGTPVSVQDFYPFGAQRVSDNSGAYTQKKGYIGNYLDDTNLIYDNARYYDPTRGRFLSEDPAFLSIGDPYKLFQLNQQEQNTILMNPQALNSYSYALNNPIINKDISGLTSQIFSENPLIPTLELYGRLNLLSEYYHATQAYLGNETRTPQQAKDANAQLQFDTGLEAAALGGTPLQRAALTVGGTALQGIDYYCSNFTCKNFADSQNKSPQDILASVANGGGNVKTSSPSVSVGNNNGNNTSVQQTARGGGGTSVQNTAAYSQFVSSLHSFTNLFSVFVSGLSGNVNSSNSNKKN